MKEMNPQSILSKIMKEADNELKVAHVTSNVVKKLYEDLNQLLYVKAYVKILEFSLEADIDQEKFDEEMKFMSEVFIRIADIENCSLVEAANNYLREMDIQFPDFSTLVSSIKDLNIDNIRNQVMSTDPFEKWKDSPKDSPQARGQVQKLMASVGWLVITTRLKEEPEFNTYITKEMEKNRTSKAGEYWSMFDAVKIAANYNTDD